ncbi:MAG: LacI family DNA-binding transcriptional regulator [Planctomycetes bacterium]|nr:LacI family DNA-binding transcriptional regulator [Planctomycetota bacterium]
MPKKVSLKTVAAEAGCSTGVASAILNKGGEGVIRSSRKTQRKVVMAARKLGLKSSYSAHRIGICAQQIKSSLPVGYLEVLTLLVTQEAIKSGLAVQNISDEKIDPSLDPSLNGIIMIGANKYGESLGGIPHFPVITINQPMIDQCIHSITSDHAEQALLAAQHAISKGHTRIALLETQPDTWGYSERTRGFKSALDAANIPFDNSMIQCTENNNIEVILQKWIDEGITLLLNFPSQTGLATISTLTNQMGLTIGKDISVISIDDLPVFQYFNPPQTVIHQSLDTLAEAAVSLMVRHIENPAENLTPTNVDNIRFSPKIIERESVKNLC